MSTQQIIILVVVIVVVIAIAAAVAATMSRKRKQETETRRSRAGELRQQAGTQSPDVRQSQLAAAEADAQAELLRVKTERAEQQAAEVRRGAAADEARQEDVVREADRLDPDVDHRAEGYQPTTDLDERTTTGAGTSELDTAEPGTTRAAPGRPDATGPTRTDDEPGTDGGAHRA